MSDSEGESCEICSQQETTFVVCKMCTSMVCKECFSSVNKICISCEEAKCAICGVYLSARACNSCGRLVCEDHGTKIGEATLCEICGEKKE